MGIFGWDYPPGCHGTPYDDDPVCDICYRQPEQCICPECSVCGETGNLNCYGEGGHGMVLTPAQVAAQVQWKFDHDIEPFDLEGDER
jgi:hypothetical protein